MISSLRHLLIYRAAILAMVILPFRASADSHFLILVGEGGEASYRAEFNEWGRRLSEVLVASCGQPSSNIRTLDQRTSISLEAIRTAFLEIGSRIKPEDDFYLLMIGHGSFYQGATKFQIPGPDLTAEETQTLLGKITARRIIILNSTSCSAGFINALSGTNRIISTATKSAVERNAPYWMEHFIEALASGSADQDADNRISVLEACRQADALVQSHYTSEGLLAPEHALLDDNGDGAGTRPSQINENSDPAHDGALAAHCFIKDYIFPPNVPPALAEKYRKLLDQIEMLKREKANRPEADYRDELERLLIEAAKTNREIHSFSN